VSSATESIYWVSGYLLVSLFRDAFLWGGLVSIYRSLRVDHLSRPLVRDEKGARPQKFSK